MLENFLFCNKQLYEFLQVMAKQVVLQKISLEPLSNFEALSSPLPFAKTWFAFHQLYLHKFRFATKYGKYDYRTIAMCNFNDSYTSIQSAASIWYNYRIWTEFPPIAGSTYEFAATIEQWTNKDGNTWKIVVGIASTDMDQNFQDPRCIFKTLLTKFNFYI